MTDPFFSSRFFPAQQLLGFVFRNVSNVLRSLGRRYPQKQSASTVCSCSNHLCPCYAHCSTEVLGKKVDEVIDLGG